MTSSGKRKISARQILSDLRSGMDDSQLKQKYHLSDEALESVFLKLTAAGVLTESEVRRRRVSEAGPVASSGGESKATEWRCPACNAVQSSRADECPVCGVVVAKFAARMASGEHTIVGIPEPGATGKKSWIVAICVLLALAVVGGTVLLWPSQKAHKKPKAVATDAKPPAADKVTDEPGSGTGQLIEMAFVPEGFPLGLSVSQGSALHLFETPSPNQGFKRFPPDTDAKCYYDEFRIAGQTYLVITEESNPPKFYFDANRNGDLTDDPGPFVGEGSSLLPNHYTLEIPYGKEKIGVPYRIWLFASRMGGIRFYPVCHWQGQLLINGKTYRLVLFDANADGDYSNDPLVIDVDDDGQAAEAEKLKPGQTCDIEGTVVTLVAIARSGRWVRLRF